MRDEFLTAEDVDPNSGRAPEVAAVDVDATTFEEDAGSRVRVVDTRTGQSGTVDAAQIDRALSSGRFRLATEAERAESARARRFEDRGAQAFVEAAADTLTLGGVSDIHRTQGRAAVENQQGIREFNEGVATAGELAAGIVQGGALGALGASVAAARGAGLGARAAIAATEGAVEGTGIGLQRLSEGLLEGGGITAERLAGTVGLNALLGLGLGVVGNEVGELGSRLLRRGGAGETREAVGRLLQRQLGREAEPGVADAVMDRIARASSTGLGADDADFVRRGLSLTPEGRAVREAVDQGEATIRELVPRMRQQLDDMAQIAEATQDFAVGALKRDRVRRIIRSDGLDLVADESSGLFGRVRGLADELQADRALPGSARRARELRDIADQFEAKVTEALQSGGRDAATDAFIALDQAKRRLGRVTASSFRSRTGFQEFREPLEALYHEFRDHLEKEALYGGAARAQREINAAWSELIPKGSKFDRLFRTDAGAQEGFRRLQTADPRKLERFLRETGTERAAVDDETFEGMVELQQRLTEAISKHYDIDPELQQAITSARQNVTELQQTLGDVRSRVRAANQYRGLVDELKDRDQLLGSIGLAGLGFALGGEEGAAVGGVIGALRRPDRLMRMMAAIERRAGGFDRQAKSSIGRMLNRLYTGGRGARASLPNRGAMVGAALNARFDDMVKEIAGLRDDPEGAMERVAERTRRIADAAPGTAAELAATAARGLGHLAQRIPPTAIEPPALFTDSLRPHERVSPGEVEAFMNAAMVVENPLNVLAEAEAGTLTREHVEALREVYPGIYGSVVQTVVEEIADRDEPMPYQGRVTLSLLLGVPTDPSLSGAYLARAQAAYLPQQEAQGPAVSPSNASAPEISSAFQTQTQRVGA